MQRIEPGHAALATGERSAEARALARLNEAGSRLWRTRDLGDGLRQILAAAITLLGADKGNVQLVDPQRDVLSMTSHFGFDAAFLDACREIGPGTGAACARAMALGKRVLIEDVEVDEAFAPLRPMARKAGFRAVQSTPLIGRDRAPIGVISTHFRMPHRPSERDLRLLDLFLQQAVGFIERCRMEDALRDSEQRFRALVGGLSDVIVWEADADGFTFVSEAAEAVLGYPVEHWLADKRFWPDHIHPEDLERALEHGAAETRAGRNHEFEYRMISVDGQTVWLRDKVYVYRTGDGRVLSRGVMIDITERKRAEDRQLLFINELNHRVKNTLAVVQSIVAQTLRSTERSNDAREVLEGRLGLLSRAHDVLTQHSWEGADLDEIVARAMEPFRTAPGRILAEGSDVHLSPKQALALAMTLHELGTNAAKYGALSNDAGRVEIDWSAEPAPDGLWLRLRWRERDGPPVAPPMRKGLGSRIIESNLARDLGGETSLDFRPDGVVCLISCPVPSLPPRAAVGLREGAAA